MTPAHNIAVPSCKPLDHSLAPSVQVMLILLLSMLAMVLAAFSFYHLYLITCNITAYETFRWREARGARRATHVATAAARKPCLGSLHKSRWLQWDWASFLRHRDALAEEVMPLNMYHRGWRENCMEVLWPEGLLRRRMVAVHLKKER